MHTSRRYQDIAIINIARAPKENSEPSKDKSGGWLRIAIVITLAITLVVCGYVIGVHTGHIPAHDPLCCVYGLHLDFDFDFNGADESVLP